MDGIKEAQMEARIQELETQLKVAQEETDELMKAFAEEKQYSIEIGDYIDEMKKKVYETFQDTPAGDRIFGEAVQNPEEQCHSLDEYLAKAKRYMIQDGVKMEELEETKQQKDALEHVIINTIGWGDFIQTLDDEMIQILRDGGHPEEDLIRDQDM